MYVISLHMYIYMYVYRERERQREREYVYIYIFTGIDMAYETCKSGTVIFCHLLLCFQTDPGSLGSPTVGRKWQLIVCLEDRRGDIVGMDFFGYITIAI